MVANLKTKYIQYKNELNQRIRDKNRGKEIDPEDAKEEEYEILDARVSYLGDDNKGKTITLFID